MKKYWIYVVGCLVLLAVIGALVFNGSDKSEAQPNIAMDSTIVEVQSDEVEVKSGKDYTEKDIEAAVRKMYEEILGETDYREVAKLEKKYTSNEYQDLYSKAEAIADGEVLLGYDHWINAQDCDAPSLKHVAVKKSSDNEATAAVVIKLFKDSDTESKTRLLLIYEDGKWVVDNYIVENEGKEWSEKTFLKEYIKEFQDEKQPSDGSTEGSPE
ncbi:MAG: YbjP/YqhG family protein [Prevotella sp.]|nr:YbjP/YqhG family protein [Prevotella sp.]